MAAWAAQDDATGWSWQALVAGVLAGLAALKAANDGLRPFWSSVSGYVKDAAGVASSGSLGAVKDRLHKLVRSATKATIASFEPRRLVVIVDDLDRCPASAALSLSTTCAQLLSVEGLVVVLLGDLGALEAEAARQFGDRPGGEADAAAGRRFVEKIFQYRVDLPAARQSQLRRLGEGELSAKGRRRSTLARPPHSEAVERLPGP